MGVHSRVCVCVSVSVCVHVINDAPITFEVLRVKCVFVFACEVCVCVCV